MQRSVSCLRTGCVADARVARRRGAVMVENCILLWIRWSVGWMDMVVQVVLDR